ncbi:MAG: molybdopterin-dependent oxidoreductase [Verrucomicrobiota bacterium]
MSEEKKTDLVDVQINGDWHQFPKGTRMIEACRQIGVDVPHYCYHPKLTSPGNCRMCLVEMGMPPRLAPGAEPELDEDGHQDIQWMPRPAIACANTIAPNMGIRTDSDLTKMCREGVMELLLINHPLDCPICDQAGECSLQEFSVEHGHGGSRFREEKVKKPKNVDIGPRIRLDDERCIMCSRCIRFCDEIVDDPVLGFTDRGSHTTLTVHPGQELANNYSLNTVDICPVGALTSNDFRFQMRVWFLKETKSFCTDCGRGCNTVIGSRETEIYRQTPRENNDVNSTWMCDRGRLNFHYLHSEARLTEPMLRRPEASTHQNVTWKEAIAHAAQAITDHESGEIAIVASARLTNEELYMVKRFAKAFDIDLIATVPRIGEDDDYLSAADKNPNTNGAKIILGDKTENQLDTVRSKVNEGSVKALIVIEENLLNQGFTKEALESLDSLIAIHLLANSTASAADVVLPFAGFAEKRGSMINVTGRLQRLNKAIDAPGQVLEVWEILRDIIQAAKGENGIYTIEDLFKLMANEIAAFDGLSLAKIGDLGIPLIETDKTIPLLEREKERIASGLIVG